MSDLIASVAEEEDEAHANRVDAKSIQEMKFEVLMQRVGTSCLVTSVILFVGHIVSAAATHNPDGGSSVTGFALSLLLFFVWFAINSVHGGQQSNAAAKMSDEEQTFSPSPLDFQWRLRGLDEIRFMIPSKWLSALAATYFVSSILMASCEAFLMSIGIVSYNQDIGPIHGVRIGLALVFMATAGFCMVLMRQQPPKMSTILATLVLALTSLIGSSFLASFWFMRSDLRLITRMEMGYEVGSLQARILEQMKATHHGLLYFPFFPWTPLVVTMNCFPIPLVATSLATIIICVHLLFSIKLSQEQTNETSKPNAKTFAVCGAALIVSGFAINVMILIIPNLTDFHFTLTLDSIYKPMVFSTLSLIGGGLLSLSAASNSASMGRKFSLLIVSVLTFAATIHLVLQTSNLVQWHDSMGSYTNLYHDRYIGPCISRNESSLCHTCCHKKCISIEKQCNGVLDFFEIPFNSSNCLEGHFIEVSLLYDEITCEQRWFGLYVTLFTMAAIGMIVCLTIWIKTWSTLPTAYAFVTQMIRQHFCNQIPLE